MGHYKVFNDVRFKFLHKKANLQISQTDKLQQVGEGRSPSLKRLHAPIGFPWKYICIYRIYRGHNYGGE